jgi:hypothetical protein
MPNAATVEDCKHAVLALGPEGDRLYRDRSKLSQQLAPSLFGDDEEAEELAATCLRSHRRRARRSSPSEIVERVVERVSSAANAGGYPTVAKATRKRPRSAATRSISEPASTRTAGSPRFSSTCTRKARPSAR